MIHDISITIVNYHNEDEIARAVDSIEQHTDPAIKKQIFLVDNNGYEGEDSPALVAISERYQDVCVITAADNIGFGAGHNLVLPHLDSRYHLIANPDILLTEDSLSILIRFLEEHPDCGMVVPRIVGTDGELLSVYRRTPTRRDLFFRRFAPGLSKERMAYHTMQDMNYQEPFQVPFAQGSFLLIRTEIFTWLGGFDPRFFLYMEDADLCRRVNGVSKLMYTPDTSVIHDWRRASKKSLRLFLTHLRSVRAYFKKWGH